MLRRESISKNFILQLLYQGIILAIPLILSPYLTRTLQETALGTYSYVNSVAYYFVILANLGISRHGQRIISINFENQIGLRKSFWSLFTLHTIISVFAIGLYFGFIRLFVHEDTVVYIIESMYVISALFDITWLFYGLENFKSVVLKNGIIKIVECVLIFAFVHSHIDLWKYTTITASAILVGQMVMIPQAIKMVKPIRFSISDMREHIQPLLVLSVSVIAATLYTVFDKTLLGVLATKESVAFYEYSNRIINVPKSIVSVVGTVMYPRACKLAATGDTEGQKKYMSYSCFFTALIGMASIFGLLGVANLFAIIYYGGAFSICGYVMISLSPLVYIVGMGDIVRTQYMIPNGMDKQYTFCIVLNAVVNIVLSILLIPIIGIFGAVIGTISAEIFGLVFQTYLCRRFIKFSDIIKSTVPFAFIGGIMLLVIKLSEVVLPYNLVGLCSEVLIGIIVFGIGTLVYTAIFRKDVWNIVAAKIKSRKG